MKPRSLFALAVVATAACGETGTEVSVTRRFDNPVDVAFGCYGGMRRTDTMETTVSPQPLSSCRTRAIGSPAFDSNPIAVPPGQEGIQNSAMFWYTAAVQPTTGTITVAYAKLIGLADRGRLAVGMRADLVAARWRAEGAALVDGVWRQGVRIA